MIPLFIVLATMAGATIFYLVADDIKERIRKRYAEHKRRD